MALMTNDKTSFKLRIKFQRLLWVEDFERKSAEFLSGSTEIRYLGHDLVDPDFAVVDFEGDVSEHVAHERLVVGLLALRVELNSGHRHFEGSTR